MPQQIESHESDGELTLHTGRAGIGSKVGHDLTIRVGTWSATAAREDGGAVTSVKVVADLSSLEVLRGDGGLKPLSEKDKKTILSNAMDTLSVKSHPTAVFQAEGLQLSDGSSEVAGRLTLAGKERPQQMKVTVKQDGGRARVQVTCEVVQSEFAIKPYSGMLGALKVRDMVEVRADFSATAG